MQKLKVYQSLWAMELRQKDGFEWSHDQKFQMIKQAGFDGICLDPAAHEIADNLALKPLFEKYNLACMVNAFPKSDEDLRALLQFSKDMSATTFSIIGTVYPLSVQDALVIIRRWMDIGADMGVDIMFETHRDCITNDMFLTVQLIEALADMRLCADLSHYVLNRELALPLSDQFSQLFDKLIERSDCFQGRISNREQIQIPIAFPQHAQWLELFKMFWLKGFKAWRARNPEHSEMVFLCELGPPPYAITDADGCELSDRWQEALTIKKWVEDIWQQSA